MRRVLSSSVLQLELLRTYIGLYNRPLLFLFSHGELVVQLTGGGECSGRVEVYHRGQWGSVCSDSWDSTDAAVVCREVGCPSNAVAKKWSYFGSGVGLIWLKSAACTGSESSLKQCNLNTWGANLCSVENDAGVICRGRNDTVLRYFYVCCDNFSDC